MKLKTLPYSLLFLPLALGFVEGQRPGKPPVERKPATPIPNVHFAAGRSAMKIPFEVLSSLVLVQVRINDSGPLCFILDTGAETSVLDAQQAKALSVKRDGQVLQVRLKLKRII